MESSIFTTSLAATMWARACTKPARLAGEAIPIYSRIALLAQVVDVFHAEGGRAAALAHVAAGRPVNGRAPAGGELRVAALDRAVAYIAGTPAVWEVILTGGDPLVLSPRRIAEVTARLSAIPHVQILRWHTRVPVVDPSRVTDAMLVALKSDTKTVYVGIHANHPRELTDAAKAACRRLAQAGLSLVSQTVLLKGVNDDAQTLMALFRAFVTMGIRPYYLHHADLAPGTSRFRTDIAEGQALMRALRGTISGLALPTYILDVPGGYGKVPVGPNYVDAGAGEIRDVSGRPHAYPPASS